VLHRDVKPSNLLLDLHGVVWVTDFGLAKADDQENLTNTGDLLGTLRYMPPEAFEGHSDARSDVYALGLTLYELLALRPAFDERKREQIIKQVTTTDPPLLGALNRAIPRDLQTIVHKAIEKDPDHRYKSAGDLAADLRRFLADQTILARRVSPAERFARWCRRNPTVAGLTGAVFLLLVGAAFIATAMAIRIEGKAEEAQFEANRANTETDRANAALHDAALNLELAQVLLAEQFVHRGAGLLADGDPSGAALCYAKALAIDPVDPDRTEAHRIRLAGSLREAPRPRHAWFHAAPVTAVDVSPDGKAIVVGCDDGTVHLWDLGTGAAVRAPLAIAGTIRGVAFAAGGNRLWAAGGGDRPGGPPAVARLWDLATGAEVVRIDEWVTLAGSDAGPDGRWVEVTLPPDGIEYRDADTGDPLGPAIRRPPTAPAHWQYRTAAVRAGRTVVQRYLPVEGQVQLVEARLWDLRAGQPVGTPIRCRNPLGAFAGPDRESLVTFAPDGTLQWYATATGARGPTFAPPGGRPVDRLAVSPDGRRLLVTYHRSDLASVRRTSARVLDGRTGRPIGGPIEFDAQDTAAGSERVPALSRDGGRMISTGPGGRLDLRTGGGVPLAAQPSLSDGLREVRFSPDGGYLLGVGADQVRVWSAASGRPVTPLLPHPGTVRSARFSSDGSHVLATSGVGVWVWPIERADGKPLVPAGFPAQVLSADGRRVLEAPPIRAGGERPTAVVRDAATREVVAGPVPVPISFGVQMRLRPDGRAALFARAGLRPVRPATVGKGPPGESGPVLWDCDSGRVIPLDAGDVVAAEFSPDGRFVRTVAGRGTMVARLWDATTGERAGSGVRYGPPLGESAPPPGNPVATGAAAWSADSSRLALIEGDQGRIRWRTYDPWTGKELASAPLDTPAVPLAAAALNDAGDAVMAVWRVPSTVPGGGAAMQVRVWDSTTGRPRTPVLDGERFGGVVLQAVLAPAGDRVAVVVRPRGEEPAADVIQTAGATSPGAAAAVRVWDVAAGREVGTPMAHERGVLGVWFHPSGDRLATTTPGGSARLWSATTGELLRVLAGPDRPTTVRFSADGRRAVTMAAAPGGQSAFGTLGQSVPAQVADVRTGHPLTPVLDLAGRNRAPGELPVSAQADRLLVARPNGPESLYELDPDDRPTADLVALAELLSSRHVTAGGLVQGLGPAAYREAWAAGRERFAADRAAPPVEGVAWHRRHRSSLMDGQARWHLDRLVAAEPDEPRHRTARGWVALRLGDWRAAEADLTWALERGPATAELLSGRAATRAELGKWEAAEADLVEAARESPTTAGRVALALVRLRHGDEVGYRAECGALFAAAARKSGVTHVDTRLGIWPGLLKDGVLPDLEGFQPGPESLYPRGGAVGAPFHVEAAVRYRQGYYATAATALGPNPDRAVDYYLLAMAQHRMGKPEAKASLEAGRRLEADPVDPEPGATAPSVPHWQADLATAMLRKEAEGLIGGEK
jgi:WD40 repeat protein